MYPPGFPFANVVYACCTKTAASKTESETKIHPAHVIHRPGYLEHPPQERRGRKKKAGAVSSRAGDLLLKTLLQVGAKRAAAKGCIKKCTALVGDLPKRLYPLSLSLCSISRKNVGGIQLRSSGLLSLFLSLYLHIYNTPRER